MNYFTPAEFVENYASIGEKKSNAPFWKLFLLGIFGGLFIGLGGAVTSTVSHSLTNVGLIRLVSGLLFPFGLITIIMTGTELFTGNCLISISVLDKKASVGGMLKNLAAVYLGNFVGSVLLAAGLAFFGQMNYSGGMLGEYSIKLAALKCSMPFLNAFVSGIFCNILVCAGVVLALCAKDVAGRAVGAYVPVALFVLCGFEHCVANMFFIPAGLFALTVPKYAALAVEAGVDTSVLTWGNFLIKNLLPVTLGNIVGGVALGVTLWVAHRKKG